MIIYKVARTYSDDRGKEDLESVLAEGFEPLGVQKMEDYIEYICRKIIPEEVEIDDKKVTKMKKN